MKQLFSKVSLILCVFGLSIAFTYAQPSNQTCATAITLGCTSGIQNGTTIGATNINIGAGSCTNNNLGVWYRIVGDGSIASVVLSPLGTNWDYKMIVFSGTCVSKTLLSCIDVSGSGGNETATFQTNVGTDYFIYVTNPNASNTITGEFKINYTCTPSSVPTNTNCATPTVLSCGTTNLSGTTFGATQSTAISPTCAKNTGVWYSFVGNGQNMQVSTNSLTNWDHAISVFTGTCGAMTQVACVNGSTVGMNRNESYTFGSVVGVTYCIFVSSATSGTNPSGNFNISLTCVNAPPNQFCANPIDLPCGTTNLSGSTIGALQGTLPTGLCLVSRYGSWYAFTGDGSTSTISANTTGFDIKLIIFTGSCTAATQIACKDAVINGAESHTFNTVNGTQYYVYVAHQSSSSTITGNFQISRTCTTVPPPNDACADAIDLTCGANLNQTTFNAEINPVVTGNCGNRYGVWYKMTGTGQLWTVFSKGTSVWNHTMTIFAGTCGNLIPIACKNSAGIDGIESHSFISEVGQTYYVFVAGDNPNSTTTGTFTISFQCETPPAGGLSSLSGSICNASLPFCSDQSYYFPNMVDAGTGQVGPNYGCISQGSTRNPVWYYMNVNQSGSLIINLNQTDAGGGNSDVDFVLWGPFTDEINACTQIGAGVLPIQTGFKASGQETVGIGSQGGSYLANTNCVGVTTPPNAIAGETYVIMITNYSNRPGFITFNQTGGTGLTDCSIVVLGGFLDLNGKKDDARNQLNWNVEREISVMEYRLERSTDGVNWEQIELIAPTDVSAPTKSYTTYDKRFSRNLNYYRVLSVNFDGETTNSPIVSIDNTSSGKLLSIFNTMGQEVDESYKGLKIYYYSDGSTVKKM